MTLIEAFTDYMDINDDFDKANMQIDLYIESAKSELDINIQKSELKVMTESGTDDDLNYLVEMAEDGAISKITKAVKTAIDAFIKFIKDLKDRVVRIVVSAATRDTMNKVEKKIKINPFLAKKKVQVTDKKKALKVIAKYKDKCDRDITKVKAGIFEQSDVEGIYKNKENFERDYKEAVTGAASLVTITVANLMKQINSDMSELPKVIDKIDNETTESVNRFVDSISNEDAKTATKAAYTACANFRTKLGKAEANEYVDSLWQAINVLKKTVNKVKGNTEADSVKENVFDDLDDDFDSEDLFKESYNSEDLLNELQNLLDE